MGQFAALIHELKHEATGTRRMLENISTDKLTWKPHEKSKTLGQLAAHVAEIPRWANHIMTEREFNMATNVFDRVKGSSKEEIITSFEQVLARAVEVLEHANDEEWTMNWAFKSGDHTVFDLPRYAAVRSMVMNHLIHHRGQLSVYLRLLNIPVPGMYGPSADER
ncbi:MAG TPA: DinB family protein [Agriterribacter sp.]|nr:DinB family protein [Agriterribacter sp.]